MARDFTIYSSTIRTSTTVGSYTQKPGTNSYYDPNNQVVYFDYHRAKENNNEIILFPTGSITQPVTQQSPSVTYATVIPTNVYAPGAGVGITIQLTGKCVVGSDVIRIFQLFGDNKNYSNIQVDSNGIVSISLNGGATYSTLTPYGSYDGSGTGGAISTSFTLSNPAENFIVTFKRSSAINPDPALDSYFNLFYKCKADPVSITSTSFTSEFPDNLPKLLTTPGILSVRNTKLPYKVSIN